MSNNFDTSPKTGLDSLQTDLDKMVQKFNQTVVSEHFDSSLSAHIPLEPLPSKLIGSHDSNISRPFTKSSFAALDPLYSQLTGALGELTGSLMAWKKLQKGGYRKEDIEACIEIGESSAGNAEGLIKALSLFNIGDQSGADEGSRMTGKESGIAVRERKGLRGKLIQSIKKRHSTDDQQKSFRDSSSSSKSLQSYISTLAISHSFVRGKDGYSKIGLELHRVYTKLVDGGIISEDDAKSDLKNISKQTETPERYVNDLIKSMVEAKEIGHAIQYGIHHIKDKEKSKSDSENSHDIDQYCDQLNTATMNEALTWSPLGHTERVDDEVNSAVEIQMTDVLAWGHQRALEGITTVPDVVESTYQFIKLLTPVEFGPFLCENYPALSQLRQFSATSITASSCDVPHPGTKFLE